MLKRTISVSVVCLLACACARERDHREAERYIIESERAWAESVATGDSSVVERILADDFVGVDPKGRAYDKSRMVSETREASKYFVSNHANEIKVRFMAIPRSHRGTRHGSAAAVIRCMGGSFGQTHG